MRFKAQFTLSKKATAYSGRQFTLTCNICGLHNTNSTTSQWYMDRPAKDDESGLWRGESAEHSCREILYSSLTSMSYFVDEVKALTLHDIPIGHGTGNNLHAGTQVIEDLANAFWLGLTTSTNRFSYTNTCVNMPVEFLDPLTNAGGPMFSICGWFLKQGTSGLYTATEVGHSRPAPLNFIVEHTARLRELLASEDKLTATRRKDILREAVKFLWIDLNHRTLGSSDFHQYCKYAVLWSGLGGLDFMNVPHGFTYSGVGVGLVANGSNKVPEKYEQPQHYCPHVRTNGNGGYNGSHSFFRSYFNQNIDGRSVTRFVNGGMGMLKPTAIRYMRYRPWSVKS